MPVDSGQAGRNQLQRYLEQLYGNSNFYNLLASPQNTKNLLIQGAAAEGAKQNQAPQPPPPRDTSNDRENSIIARNTTGFFGGPNYRPPTGPNVNDANLAKMREALEGSWLAQGMAPYSSPTLPLHSSKPMLGPPAPKGVEQSTSYKLWNARNLANATNPMSNAIPNMVLQPNPTKPTGQRGTPNQTIINLENARAKVEANAAKPGFGSPGKTSLDLDPNLNGTIRDPLADLEAEIRRLANQPDIPGQWISPYSQEYLNGLGDRLGQAGSEAQQQFQGAIGDVVNNYGATGDARNTANTKLVNELQGNGSNIGINYGASAQGQQAATDADYLNQVASQNQATDTSFMSKMGELANFYGGNLSAQAKEGLLTPKQWQGPQSGIDAGEQALLGFLNSKYQHELGLQDSETDFERDMALAAFKGQLSGSGSGSGSGQDYMGPRLTENADEYSEQLWPGIQEEMSKITDPKLLAEFQQIWGPTTDPVKATDEVYRRMREDVRPSTLGQSLAQVPAGQIPDVQYQNTMGNLAYQVNEQRAQDARWQAILEILNRNNPGLMSGVVTKRTTGTGSQQKYPYDVTNI